MVSLPLRQTPEVAGSGLQAPGQLNGADGIALDTAGGLYIAVNDNNGLYRLSLTGGLVTRLADRSDGSSTRPSPRSTRRRVDDALPGQRRRQDRDRRHRAFDVDATCLPLPRAHTQWGAVTDRPPS